MGAQCVKPQGESVEFYKTPSVALFPVEPDSEDEAQTNAGEAPSDAGSATPPLRLPNICSQSHCLPNSDDEATPVPYGQAPGQAKDDANSGFHQISEQVTPRLIGGGCFQLAGDGLAAEESLPAVKERVQAKGLVAKSEDMELRQVLCTTFKSTVCIADWRGQKVVVKRIKRDLIHKEDEESKETRETSMREMLHELHILTCINHPCLVNLLGANVERQDEPFFVTEYMEGGDVESYMHKQRQASINNRFKPRFSLALQWATSTAEALTYLHGLEQPIIHRDLKPLNLLLTRDLQVKVTDFGISKVMPFKKGSLHVDPKSGQKMSEELLKKGANSSQSKEMTGGVGTWRYMAPEVVRYEQYTDRADIYSFSLIVYFIFSGRQPFHSFCGPDPEKILKAYVRGKEPRPDLELISSVDIKSFLQEAWHPKAAQRPSAGECLDRLHGIRQQGVLHAVHNMSKALAPFTRAVSH